MLRGLRTVVFDVDNLEKAKAWYEEATGAAPYFDQPFYVGFDVGGYELGLRPADGRQRSGIGGDTAYWAVDDMEGAHAALLKAGARPAEPVTEVGDGIRVASVVDPFGNRLGLIDNPHFAPRLTWAPAGDISARSIHKEALVAATPADAWALWATSDGIAKWWVPDAKIELRPGGPYELYFLKDNPPGRRGGDGCRVLSFVPGRMLSFTWNAPPELPKTRPLHTWVALHFSAEEGRCRVTLDHLGWPESGLADKDSQWPATFAYFDDAWERVMELFAQSATTP